MRITALDSIDRILLGALAQNGRVTYTDLGQLCGLSSHAVAPRVKRLIDSGVITGFSASIDHAAIGRGLEALVDIRLLSTTVPEEFERAVAELVAARELSFLTGRFDYQLRAACLHADDLDQTVRALRRAGAAVTETRMMLRTRTFPPPLPDRS